MVDQVEQNGYKVKKSFFFKKKSKITDTNDFFKRIGSSSFKNFKRENVYSEATP